MPTSYRHRPAASRGTNRLSWLNANFSFSFAGYYDPQWTGFRNLLVLNEDFIAGGGGFGTHGHEHMEIITYPLSGGIEHRDSSGGGGIVRHGDVQVMHAGTGIRHSEFNASAQDEAHLFQIWIQPRSRAIAPGYLQARYPLDEAGTGLHLIASHDGRDGSLLIHADADLQAGTLAAGTVFNLALPRFHHAWIQLATGSLSVDAQALRPGDGLAVSDATQLRLQVGEADAELVVIALA